MIQLEVSSRKDTKESSGSNANFNSTSYINIYLCQGRYTDTVNYPQVCSLSAILLLVIIISTFRFTCWVLI